MPNIASGFGDVIAYINVVRSLLGVNLRNFDARNSEYNVRFFWLPLCWLSLCIKENDWKVEPRCTFLINQIKLPRFVYSFILRFELTTFTFTFKGFVYIPDVKYQLYKWLTWLSGITNPCSINYMISFFFTYAYLLRTGGDEESLLGESSTVLLNRWVTTKYEYGTWVRYGTPYCLVKYGTVLKVWISVPYLLQGLCF